MNPNRENESGYHECIPKICFVRVYGGIVCAYDASFLLVEVFCFCFNFYFFPTGEEADEDMLGSFSFSFASPLSLD